MTHHTKQEINTKTRPGATRDFKIWMVILIFLSTCILIIEMVYLPGVTLVSNEFLLGSVLAAITYLWVQEVKDRKKLEAANKELLIAQEELKEANIATMRALIVSEEARDPYIRGHSQRVTEYALAIAGKLKLSDSNKKHIEYAGYLHDIGKIGISDAILHKPGRLDDKEWEVIKRHPVVGVELLAPLKFLPEEKIIVRHHHERYDGKGYPDGLKGKDIPLGARIMCVADSFDAMNSKRAYRASLPRAKILSELKTSRGTQFDPEMVDAFMDIVEADDSIFENK